jgi:multicomponent K+:H+ antiporter subunit D
MSPHFVVAPVVLPLVAGAALLLVERRRPQLAGTLSFAATIAFALVALRLLARAESGAIDVYLLGNWPAPFGIALALDRLAALMLALTAVVALGSHAYALGGEARRGVHFHALFQFQLMGLAGAFLTADLFNLFVFFEVLLIASYGLLLHAADAPRLKAAVHYVTFNLVGSALFLFAVALLFAVTGTLNLADLAQRLRELAPANVALAQAGALLLLVVFSVKAALLPLYFWLPDTYGAAAAPVAALFAILTKVGVYAIARVTTLLMGGDGGALAAVAWPWLPLLALATLALGAAGALAATRLRALAAYLIVASAGTLLTAIGLGTPATVAAGLFYLVNSTLMAALFFLLIERIGAQRPASDQLLPAPFGAEREALGALFFVVALAAAGMPPLAGFFGKALILHAARDSALATAVWVVVLVTSFAVVVALARAGSTVFWKPALPGAGAPPAAATLPAQRLAIGGLLVALAAAAIGAQRVGAYADATADQLLARRPYVEAVLQATPAAPAFDLRGALERRFGKAP